MTDSGRPESACGKCGRSGGGRPNSESNRKPKLPTISTFIIWKCAYFAAMMGSSAFNSPRAWTSKTRHSATDLSHQLASLCDLIMLFLNIFHLLK